ncbi:LysM peptidoglycan-binding domain-containing protein [Listeria cornellensis]|uniref:Pepdidoglycan bound protein n=1 Tax=Listeria cornellensis FSL F6-0969 TaxID=1265820 RepID=W7C260_9LIST|nr:LysM peptidoglycan-binding domain-containing protein [Listeria cornellensis]EUJ26713.1 pepdidoglycan bound protein [Listeria cornellensis FSL F6-0969]
MAITKYKSTSSKKGDTLPSIAEKFETTTQQLKIWNNLANDEIQVGQKLIVKVTPRKVAVQNQNNVSPSPTTTMKTLPQTGDATSGVAELTGALLALTSGVLLIRKK